MSGEGFLRRWARRKTEVREGREPAPVDAPAAEAAAPVVAPAAAPLAEDGATQDIAAWAATQPQQQAPAAPQPVPGAAQAALTMDDVATLDRESDFSAFVARGVDQAVRRGALKKLFADPHFNVMDKLDVYIDDYTKPSPMSDAMLASLEHAKSVFMKLAEDAPEVVPEAVTETQAPPQQSQQPTPPEQETQ
jgi:hypothetical protein